MRERILKLLKTPAKDLKSKWIYQTQECLKNGAYKKPDLPYFYIDSVVTDDTEETKKTIHKILANWSAIEAIGADYNHLLDYIIETGNNDADKTVVEYAEFLKLYIVNGRFDWSKAKEIYTQQYKHFFDAFRSTKKGTRRMNKQF